MLKLQTPSWIQTYFGDKWEELYENRANREGETLTTITPVPKYNPNQKHLIVIL